MSDNLNNRLPRIIVPGYYSRKYGSCSVLSTETRFKQNQPHHLALVYRVSQKFVPLLYKSVTQYDWTLSAHNLTILVTFSLI